MNLHRAIFIGMFGGVILGLLLWSLPTSSTLFQNSLAISNFIGRTLFVGSLKMLVAPLLLATIVSGIASLPGRDALCTLGTRTLLYYFTTTSIAAIIGIVLVMTFRPGESSSALKVREKQQSRIAAQNSIDTRDQTFSISESEQKRLKRIEKKEKSPVMFLQDIVNEMIQNPFRALANGSSLGIIFFSLLLGVACLVVGAPADPVKQFFFGFNQVILKITTWVMQISPVAVFCLMVSIVAENGPGIFQTLSGYIGTVLLGIFIHVGILLYICWRFAGVTPVKLFRGLSEAWLIAFSTRSSAATLPVTISCVENQLGVSPKISRFVLPVGATVNMDGTALYEGVAVLFLVQLFGPLPDVGLSAEWAMAIPIFLTAVIASIGAAAVPDAGLITMVIVAGVVGLPEEYLVFIFAVDAFLDMFRTSTNVMGDAVGAVVVNAADSKSSD